MKAKFIAVLYSCLVAQRRFYGGIYFKKFDWRRWSDAL